VSKERDEELGGMHDESVNAANREEGLTGRDPAQSETEPAPGSRIEAPNLPELLPTTLEHETKPVQPRRWPRLRAYLSCLQALCDKLRIPVVPEERQTFFWGRWLYLRILGIGFLLSFLSIWSQVMGLIGPRGILPARDLIAALSRQPGWTGFMSAPSLLWLDSGPLGIQCVMLAGTIAGLLLALNVLPRISVFVCWACYLSFVSVARNFSGFQSDGLMLESAFLALFLAPGGFRPGLGEKNPVKLAMMAMFGLLIFRLMFGSGIAKLLSADTAWWFNEAMDDYYVNCPFPTWIGWAVQQMPRGFHSFSSAFALFVEVICPLLILMGKWPRRVVALIWMSFQIGILLTANYTFLNYNSIALGLLMLDDGFFTRFLRLRGVESRTTDDRGYLASLLGSKPAEYIGLVATLCRGVLFVFLAFNGLIILLGLMRIPLNSALQKPLTWVQGFRTVNRYALFAAMTHHRHHIEFEGSQDGKTWKPYKFKWQAQRTDQAPRFMAPHLPRFDWNLWFAQLSTYQDNRHRFVLIAGARLLEGEPSVIDLFAENPFIGQPPRYIRFPFYKMTFSDGQTLETTGEWWRKQPIGYWAPILYKDSSTGEFKLTKEPPTP